MTNPRLFIGLDAGGTKTHLVAETTDGASLQLDGSGANPHRAGFPGAAAVLADLITQACDAFPEAVLTGVCAGVAGAGNPDDQDTLAQLTRERLTKPDLPLQIIHDGRIALEGAFEGDSGVIVVAGTGSVVFGRSVEGRFLRAGGWGYLVGDEGSGHLLGARGLNAVAAAFDGGPGTALRALLADREGIVSEEHLKRRVYRNGWPVAQAAPLVLEAAEAGDGVTLAIVIEQTKALARQVRWLAGRASIAPNMALLGGLVGNAFYRQHLVSALQERLPGWQIVAPRHSAAVGALRLARQVT